MQCPLQVMLVFTRADDRERVLVALRESGYTAAGPQAASAREAENELHPGLDLLICEDAAGQEDAFGLLQAVRTRGLSLPVIVIGAEGRTDRVVACMQQGAANYLTWENLANLAEAVRQALEPRFEPAALGRDLDPLRTLFEGVPDIVCYQDNQGRWLEANPAALRLFGLEGVDYRGLTDAELAASSPIFAKISSRFLRIDEPAWQAGQISRSEEDIPTPYGMDTYDIIKMPVFEPDGRRKGLAFLGRNVTGRKQAEIENRSRYQQVFNHSPVGIAYYDANAVSDCNDRLAVILQTTRAQICGQNYLNLQDQAITPTFEAALRGEEGFYEGLYRTTSSQKEIWISIRSAPLYDALGEVKGGIAIVEDINQRKQAEIQSQRQVQRLAALHQIDVAITSSLDVHMTLNLLLNQIIRALEISAANIRLFNRFSQTLDYVAGKGFRTGTLPRRSLRFGEGLSGRAALEQRIMRYPDPSNSSPNRPDELWIRSEYAACFAVPLVAKGQVKGVLEIYHNAPMPQNQDWLDFLNALAVQAAIAVDNSELFDNLQRTNVDLSLTYDQTLVKLIQAVDRRERMPETHARCVTDLTMRLARAVGISDEDLPAVRRGAFLHDIGKLVVPEYILLKPGPLNPEEWKIMQEHPGFAYQMLSSISQLQNALDIPYCHHERWDGSGYPRKLKGEQIPLAARVFTVVDTWDVLRTRRPYREAWPKDKIRNYLVSQAGILFDPKIVGVFVDQFWGELSS